MFVFGGEEFQARQEQAYMDFEARQRELIQFLDSLCEDQVNTLLDLLRGIERAGDDATMIAAWYVGYLQCLRWRVFEIDPVTGQKFTPDAVAEGGNS